MRLSAISVISISNIDIIVYQYVTHRWASSTLLFFDNFGFSFDIPGGSRHSSGMTNNADISALIRNIPDYPKPGILFRDVSTLLLDGPGFRATIDRLARVMSTRSASSVSVIRFA
jgi:hypothetical protein